MKKIKEILMPFVNTVLETLKPLKKIIITLVIVFFFLVIVPGITKMISEHNANQTPIKSIKATNNKIYSKEEVIKLSDFTVTAIHENEKTSSISSDRIKLSQNNVNNTGHTTLVEISLKDNESIKTKVKIKNKREKIEEISCGKPEITDVKAVLYSNGELCFEGKGNVRNYRRNEFPWMLMENTNEIPITSISFEKNVKPESMDYWFENMESIEYVDNIPTSVKSAVNTFNGCSELSYLPSLKKNEKLINTESMCAYCSKLDTAPDMPINVRIADSMFEGDTALQKAPQLSSLSSLQSAKSMFEACEQIITGDMAPNLVDVESMYANCINLREAPTLPETVRNANSCFLGNTSLVSPSDIPKGVFDVSNCYQDCYNLTGMLVISGNPSMYSSFLSGASRATKLDLSGSSAILDVLANTSDGNNNITVNGKEAAKDADIDDQIELTEE